MSGRNPGCDDDTLPGGGPDGIVHGTDAGELIDAAYIDAQGDQPDNPAQVWPGRGPLDDIIQAGAGNDTIIAGDGNDSMYGEGGDDVFAISDDFGNHLIVGGETGEVFGDKISATDMTQDVEVIYTGDEQGTITRDGAQITFSEIERTFLGQGDDRVEVVSSTTGKVHGGDGFDTLVLPDPAPGEEGPRVTITSETDNGDGTVSKDGFVEFPDGSRLDFQSFEEIICFTPGTLIDTARGLVVVEDLAPGDRVLTRDNGYQPLAWTGRKDLAADQVAAFPGLAPVRISAGALGRDLPARDLRVSPRHRMLVTGPRAELMFGEREVLVAAIDLLGLPGITQEAPEGALSYIHVMCPGHEILRAEGSWSESFQPGAAVLNGLAEDTRAELLALFPELGTEEGQRAFAAARPALTPTEARALFAA